MFKYNRVLWALRKIFLPVVRNGLVLDVGSGGTPYPRSDVLLDRLTGADHRCGDSMMIDRVAVFGDAQKMPFKNKSFDFIVASHILEHMAEPEKFLNELQRVGKAGYIETPNAIFERLRPYNIHCLEVMKVDGVLHIHKKSKPVEDSFLGVLEFLDRDSKWSHLFFERLDLFHVRLFWDEKIPFQINNPDVSCDWIEAINNESDIGEDKQSYLSYEKGWRKSGLSVLNFLYSMQRRKRLKQFDILDILCCPNCLGELTRLNDLIICNTCTVEYDFVPDGIPDFTNGRPISSAKTINEKVSSKH